MAFESISPNQKIAPKKVESAGISRREFLKKAGKVLGGALIAGNMLETVKEMADSALGEKDFFSREKLEKELVAIKNEFGEKWEEEAKRKIKTGIDAVIELLGRKDYSEPALKGIVPFNVPQGFTEGTLVGAVVEFLKRRAGEITSGVAEDKKIGREDVNKVFLWGSGGAIISALINNFKDSLAEKDPKLKEEKFRMAMEEAAFKTINPEEKIKISQSDPGLARLLEDLKQIFEQETVRYTYALSHQAKLKSAIEQYGAGSFLALYSQSSGPQKIELPDQE